MEVLPVLHGEVKLDDRLLVQRPLRLRSDLPLARGHLIGGPREGARLVEVGRVRLGPRMLLVQLPHPIGDLDIVGPGATLPSSLSCK